MTDKSKEMGSESIKSKSLVSNNDVSTPASVIRYAIENKADVEELRGLLELQKDWEANEARKAYHLAMAEFKANPPKIDKDRTVSYGQGKASYKHASLYNVTQKIGEALSKHKLSASWSTKQNGQIVVTCKITHALGHSEETTLSASSDTSGSKNSIQAIGSTITYLERYTLLALTGLATCDDDDGTVGAPKASGLLEAEKTTLYDWLTKAGITEEKLLSLLNVESVDAMTRADYNKAIAGLKAKVTKK